MSEALSSMEHYVGTTKLRARFNLEEGGVNKAEEDRRELIGILEGIEDLHPLISKCIDYLKGTCWDSQEKIDSFGEFYDSLVSSK